jgi:pyruvate kinase
MTAHPTDPLAPERLQILRERLIGLREATMALEAIAEDELALVHPDRRIAARNLVDYLAVSQHDLRDLQRDLYETGLTSLGVVHRHVVGSIDGALRLIDRVLGRPTEFVPSAMRPPLSPDRAALAAFADDALGPIATSGAVRVMVTMPSEAGDDPEIIERLVAHGMTLMRVNCAHDGPETWGRMVAHLRAAERRHGTRCKVAFDLAGPKLRTGPVVDGPEVIRARPVRDSLGRSVSPAAIRLIPGMLSHGGDDHQVLPVDPVLCVDARAGDDIILEDARGRKRDLEVVAASETGLLCTCDRTVYLTTGTPLTRYRDGNPIASGRIGQLPATRCGIPLTSGDLLVVTRILDPGHAAVTDDERVLKPASIGCTLVEVFDCIEPGHRVLLDDGKFEGMVREVNTDSFVVEITRAGRSSATLYAEKGINLPDTSLHLPALTGKDLVDLDFVASHGDLVSLSFVHRQDDIDTLHRCLDERGAGDVGIILKIETRAAFEALPRLLMTAAKRKRVAVMVARGDLGVEIGFERLAEVQEEMLWICEASQVPVIWATQVLESLAKDGLPSRAEVTDAAMSVRAECVMLNKGRYIAQAVRFLNDVSKRMSAHSQKTYATHRPLSVAASAWLEGDRSEPVPRSD